MSSAPPPAPARLEVIAAEGIGEITEGTDLCALVAALPGLTDGDVVVLTSKVVSKAEGRVVPGERADVVAAETVRPVARRGDTAIVENHLGLVMAAAGVDASNVDPGLLVLLPRDPDASARAIRRAVLAATGRNVAVLVTDTAGRAWREGQTDIAIGAAGLDPLTSFAGAHDHHGNPLVVTAPAVADELAASADLVAGKIDGRPVVVVRGFAARVRPPGDDGPGARSLVRPRRHDMFGLGAREAVVAAVRAVEGASFGAPARQQELVEALAGCGWHAASSGADVTVDGETGEVTLARVVAFAHGWDEAPGPATAGRLLLRPR